MKTCILAIATLFLAATSTFGQFNGQQADRIRIEVELTNVGANGLASARARFESRRRGNFTRLKFDVEGEDLSADFTEVDVFLNGELLASVPIELGRFDVDLDTGKGGVVPSVSNGDVVDIVDSSSAALLFTGTFGDTGGKNDPGAGGEDVELEIDLINFGANPLASATANHETRPDRVKFNVEGEDLTSEFTFVDIYAAGIYIDTVIVDMFGRFNLDIDTSEGDNNVPVLAEGDLVEVINSEDGSLMFAGMLSIAD